MLLRAVSPPVWALADRTWSQGQLRCLRTTLLEVSPLFMVIASLPFFTWVTLGIFSPAISEWTWKPWLAPQSFLAFFCLFSSLCHNKLAEPFTTGFLDWFGPNTCFSSLWQISESDWMRNLYFNIILPSALSGSVSVNLWRASHSLSRNLPGASFFPYFMFVNLVYFKVLSCTRLISDKVTLILSSFSHVIVPAWLCCRDCLIPSREGGYVALPLFYWFITKPFISIGTIFPLNLSFWVRS